jgi:hypothetical protein
MKKILLPLLLLLASCVGGAASQQSGLPSNITENVITESVITETTISETTITLPTINPLKQAYADAWVEGESSGFYDEYQTNPAVPYVDFRMEVPNTVQQGSGVFRYEMFDFRDEQLTFAALIVSVATEGESLLDGWTTARMGYGLEVTYHYDFLMSIGADWFNGQYVRYANPSEVNAMSGATITFSKGRTDFYLTLAYNDGGTIRFLPIGVWSVFVD